MEAIKESTTEVKTSFINHIFKLDGESKTEMMNLFQYTLTSFVLVVILNKIFQIYIPEADETKHYTTLIFEMLIQIIGLFLGMILIHRMVTYLPTYTKTSYKEINMLGFVIPFLVILLSLQTKLGDKVNIILDSLSFFRINTGRNNGGNLKVSQPLSHTPMQVMQPIQPTTNDFASNLLPTPGLANTQMPVMQQAVSDIGPQSAGGIGLIPENDEPMAANGVLGLGSSW